MRILIIEDNAANRELMHYLLAAAGHEVLCAADGETGLAALATTAFDLVLCDIHMPGIDGYEVARRMKSAPHLAHVPLVAVTASAMDGDRHLVMAAGFDAYLTKPLEPESFVAQALSFVGGAAGARP